VRAYLDEIANILPDTIAYVDETGINSFIHREYARAKCGKRVFAKIPGKRFKNIGMAGAMMQKRIVAAMQYKGTMDGVFFEFWFEKMLLPSLPKGTTIVMDNASFHKKAKLNLLAQKHGYRLLFLPPYSPELNPIENFWSWLKNRLKKILPNFYNIDDAITDCFQVE
jgi:transposase